MPSAVHVSGFDWKQLGDELAAALPLPPGLEPHLARALGHISRNPGNLIRPQIVLRMSGAFDVSDACAKDLAFALEYFHTASLLFDDLPCMDNAGERRGAACVHVAFGESAAILAALALINRGYALVWRAVFVSARDRQMQALAYIERCLGVDGLLNGQSLDLHYAELSHDCGTTERIARGKTVSLIRLALVLPAILGGALETEIRHLERIALYWGLSYQIIDDLKDVLQSAAETGKTVSRDISLDRPNIALAIGIPGAVDRVTRLIRLGDRALSRLLISRPEACFLDRLRGDLEKESARAVQNTYALAVGGLS